MSFMNTTVVITGAARGIGKAYAKGFAALGANVVATDISDCDAVAAEIAADGGTAMADVADISEMAQMSELATKAAERFGPAAVLINNAALYGTLGGGRFQVTAGFGRMLIRKQLVAPPAPGGLRRSRSHAPATRALHCGVAPRRGKRPAWRTLALPLRHAEPWDATPPPGGGALEMGGSMYEHHRHAGGASVFQLSMPFLPPLDLPIL